MIKKILPTVLAATLFSSNFLYANTSEKAALKQAVLDVRYFCNENIVKSWSKINKNQKRSYKRFQNVYEGCKHAMEALQYLVDDKAGLGANASQPPSGPVVVPPTCPPLPLPTPAETRVPPIVAPPMNTPPTNLPPSFPPPPFASPAYTYP